MRKEQIGDEQYLAIDYTYRGKEYTLLELQPEKMYALGDLLVLLNVPGLSDITQITQMNIGEVIKAIAKERAIGKLLAILLIHKDGTQCSAEEFEKGKAAELLEFLEQVVQGFFQCNPSLISRLKRWADGLLKSGMRGLNLLLGQVNSSLQPVKGT